MHQFTTGQPTVIPFVVLLICTLLFRCVGALGLDVFSTWHDSTRYALAVMFLFTASAHFTTMKTDLVNTVPKIFPYPKQIVFITGLVEIAGAIGIVIPSVQSLAGLCLVILMIAMVPANIFAAKHSIPLRGKPPTPLWLRLALQLVFIGLTWWSTRM